MHVHTRWMFVPALMLSWLAVAGTAHADVRDKGAFFSEPAVEKANKRIEKMKDKYKKDLVIETFKEIPEDRKKDYDEKKKGAFFDRWARERAEDRKVNGVYILLCKEPGRLQIEVGNDTRKKAFTNDDRDRLATRMGELLKAKSKEKNDEALEIAVDRVTSAIEEHAKSSEKKAGTGIGGYICLGLCILAGVWLLIALVRAFSGGGGSGGGYGGGGGFFPSLLGGMFGAAAGMWMYNSFFGGGSSAFGGSAGMGSAGGDSPGGYGTDTDYSGGGSDFDGGGGGGGGGDFGGGDIGGGGDFGGGGGDF